MKKIICFLLALIFCLSLAVSVSSAENNLAQYKEWLTGAWRIAWRYLPQTAMQVNKLSDPVKPVNLFVYPGELAKSGMTVTSCLLGDETGEVWLALTTAGSSHNIVSFDGCFFGRVYMSDDHNMLLLKSLDGAAVLYARTDSTD